MAVLTLSSEDHHGAHFIQFVSLNLLKQVNASDWFISFRKCHGGQPHYLSIC